MSRRAWLCVLAACGLAAVARPTQAGPTASEDAHGDAVALLPLDAERSLEIYGQPVASELARALVAGDVQVVVVGPRMAVPDRARLIIDGTIAQGKASTVTISIRIRSALNGVTLETLSATAPGLAKIDGAAAELSGRALPLVREHLAALQRPPPEDHGPVVAGRPATAELEPLTLVAITDAAGGAGAPLAGALYGAVAVWTQAQHRRHQKLDPGKLDPKILGKVVTAAGAEVALVLSVVGYARDPGALPMARARVRVQVAGPGGIVFDRVIATDTVLGDKASTSLELASRVAREVLAILRPHLRRHVPSWQ